MKNRIDKMIYDIGSFKKGPYTPMDDYDLWKIFRALKSEVKDFYDVNGVPKNIMGALVNLKHHFQKCEDEIEKTCDIIINEIENMKTKEENIDE